MLVSRLIGAAVRHRTCAPILLRRASTALPDLVVTKACARRIIKLREKTPRVNLRLSVEGKVTPIPNPWMKLTHLNSTLAALALQAADARDSSIISSSTRKG
jgi:hypothetical protein